jgi:hypothetical protein
VQPFDLLDALGWSIAYNTGVSVALDLSAPTSPPAVLQFVYQSGFTAGHAPGTVYFPLGSVRRIYSGVWWKASDPWQGDASNVNKLEFVMAANGGGGMYLCMYGPPSGPFELRVANQLTGGDSRGWLTPNRSRVSVALGAWHHVEWQVSFASAPGRNDGVVRWWLDGQLIGEYTDFVTPATTLVEYQLSPTFGGAAGTKIETDYFWVDHIVLRGS